MINLKINAKISCATSLLNYINDIQNQYKFINNNNN